jgi:uncharacterized protein (DUF488 family)
VPINRIFTEFKTSSKLTAEAVMGKLISTIGYEGATFESFIATLHCASIQLLIDVREMPLSRKRGFSKTRLAEALRVEGIEYVHLRGLGDPKPGREAARAGNYPLFRRIFGRHMKSDEAQADLAAAAAFVMDYRACLMCYECNHTECHRSIVADALAAKTGLSIIPLSVTSTSLQKAA